MKKSLLIILLLSLQVASYAQQANDDILKYVQKAMLFNKSVPQEKVYLHFDNTGYFHGETIWFKAYLTTQTSTGINAPRSLSRVLYVELLNPSGDVVKTTKWHVDDKGMANGEIRLDSLYGTGFYEVRAYTRYMMNWGVNACFSRVFPVFKAPQEEGNYQDLVIETKLHKQRDPNNRDRSDSLYLNAIEEGIYTSDLKKNVSVKFYPEGGDLILDKKCRVAVMAVDDNGRPYRGKLIVSNAKGDILAATNTDTLGRAQFSVTHDGSEIQMQLQNLDYKIQYFPLPQPRSGAALTLDAVSENMLATIQCTDDICGKMIGFVTMNNGCITYCDTTSAQPLIEVELDRSKMPEGVNQFTVFDSEGRILADRLFFICPKTESDEKISFASRRRTLSACGAVEIDVKTQPNSEFSFTAIDAQTMTNGKSGNMKTWMLLGSDVKGYINNVDYYFEADDEAHRRTADLLMLTQGWRRYDWEMMDGNKQFDKVQYVEDKFYLYGKLNAYRKHNKVSHVNMDVALYNKSGESLSGSTVTDSLGNYSFELPFLDGDWIMQIDTKLNEKNKTYYVGIDRQFSPVARYITPLEASLSEPLKANMFVKDQKQEVDNFDDFIPITDRTHILDNVTVKAKRRFFTNDDFQYKDEKYGKKNASFFYDMDKELDKVLDLGEEEPTLCEWLAKKNSMFDYDPKHLYEPLFYGDDGVVFHLDNDERDAAFELYDMNYESEIPHFDTWLSNIKTMYIAPHSIATLPSGAFEEKPACHIYLYMHITQSTARKKGIRHSHFQGFNKPTTFQMEDYSVLPPVADFRRTIYWNPSVKTDARGNARIAFFNNSTCNEMYFNAEGVTPQGKILLSE